MKYVSWEEYRSLLEKEDNEFVPYDVNGQYGKLFDIISQRYVRIFRLDTQKFILLILYTLHQLIIYTQINKV